jgi:hypothetical protein
MSVGDINSNERGSGARYNEGKPDLSLIPALYLPIKNITYFGNSEHWRFLKAVHDFQVTGNAVALLLGHTDSFLVKYMRTNYKDCANVFTYGAKKYAAHNWMKGMKWSVPIACALRHAHALWVDGEENDSESGLPHIGHILCNLVMLRFYLNHYREGNDLPYKVLDNAAD